MDWNSLPQEVLSAKSVSSFKKLLPQTGGQKTNPVYCFGHGYDKITHTRLRPRLRSLNEHLFNYILSLNNFCEQCNRNHTETIEHYLVHCNRHTVSRITLFLGITHILYPELYLTLVRVKSWLKEVTIYLLILTINFSNAFSSSLNLQKYVHANTHCIIGFVCVLLIKHYHIS
jgi:hypothetical protein